MIGEDGCENVSEAATEIVTKEDPDNSTDDENEGGVLLSLE